jgi:hypothetical protein
MNFLRLAAPLSWAEALARSAVVAVVAFLVLQLKEFVDAGRLDTPGTAMDGILIGTGFLIVSAVLMWARPR